MKDIQFYNGLEAELPSFMTEGYVYFTTDTGKLFIDISSTERKQIVGKNLYEQFKEYGYTGTKEELQETLNSILSEDAYLSLENGGVVSGNVKFAGQELEINTGNVLVKTNIQVLDDDIRIKGGNLIISGSDGESPVTITPVKIQFYNGAYLETEGDNNIIKIGASQIQFVKQGSSVSAYPLPISWGGTGITSNPSMRINLGSESTVSIFQESPQPGVTGVLSTSHGGTGLNLYGSSLGVQHLVGGRFASAEVYAAISNDVATARIRNTSAGTADPAGLANGNIYLQYE